MAHGAICGSALGSIFPWVRWTLAALLEYSPWVTGVALVPFSVLFTALAIGAAVW